MAYLLMLIYPIGFLLTLTFFKFFGKRIGFDWDSINEEDRWPDDPQSNAEAYTMYSAVWPVMLLFGIVIGTIKIVFKFGEWFIKL